MIAIYARYGAINQEDNGLSLEETKEFLRTIADYGEGYELGIYDQATKTMHIPDNMSIAGQAEGAVLLQKMEEFRGLGLEINSIELYD